MGGSASKAPPQSRRAAAVPPSEALGQGHHRQRPQKKPPRNPTSAWHEDQEGLSNGSSLKILLPYQQSVNSLSSDRNSKVSRSKSVAARSQLQEQPVSTRVPSRRGSISLPNSPDRLVVRKGSHILVDPLVLDSMDKYTHFRDFTTNLDHEGHKGPARKDPDSYPPRALLERLDAPQVMLQGSFSFPRDHSQVRIQTLGNALGKSKHYSRSNLDLNSEERTIKALYGSRPAVGPQGLKRPDMSRYRPEDKAKSSVGPKAKAKVSSGFGFVDMKTIQSANSINSVQSNFETIKAPEKFNDKKSSLSLAGLASLKSLKNSFKESKLLNQAGSPWAALQKALSCFEGSSDNWEVEVSGIEAIVTLARKHPEVLRNDLKAVIRSMMAEVKNLRSQVTRAAAQAFGELYLTLGKSMEMDLEKVTSLLLQKTSDTNRFLREACSEALTAMCENVTTFKALAAITAEGCINHKSVAVRTEVARLLQHIASSLGAPRIFGCSRDFVDILLKSASKLMVDGSLEVRTHAKKLFSELLKSKKFDSFLAEFVAEKDRKEMKKALESLRLG